MYALNKFELPEEGEGEGESMNDAAVVATASNLLEDTQLIAFSSMIDTRLRPQL